MRKYIYKALKIEKILLVLFILFICGCAVNRYSDNEKQFYDYLQQNYKSYGDYKTENYDWKGARLFYRKANAIKDGKRLMPEKVFRNIDVVNFFSKDISYEQLLDMRDRMLLVLNDNTAKTEYPEELANLQFYYDCLVLEEKLYTKYSQIARCKQGFIDTLAYLEFKLLRLTTTERDLIQKEIDNEKVYTDVFIRPKKYVIYFDFDSSVLTEDSSRVLWEFLKDVKKVDGKYIVNITGHADRVGTKKYNQKLSKRRTDTIKHYLIKNGIPENIIAIKWQGYIDPQVITSNNYKEELNRRVVITIERID